jgi:integrase
VAGGGQEIERVHLPRHPQKRQSLGNGIGRVGDLADRPPLCCPGGPRELCPHDARRSCARIYYDAKLRSNKIQFLLGHDKLDTTARSVNDEQKFGGEAVSKVADIS